MKKKPLAVTACLLVAFASAQGQFSLSGRVSFDGKPAKNALVTLLPDSLRKTCDENGFFVFAPLPAGSYAVWVSLEGYDDYRETVEITHKNRQISVRFARVDDIGLSDVVIVGSKNVSVSGKLKDVSGTAIYAGKKTEVIHMEHINGNLATNNTRQIYARVPGLNIWEYDRGGLQLGIGGRGLSPNRSSNFNIRQNGYDISADALGDPESYYTPSSQALERIEIIRGAASLH